MQMARNNKSKNIQKNKKVALFLKCAKRQVQQLQYMDTHMHRFCLTNPSS